MATRVKRQDSSLVWANLFQQGDSSKMSLWLSQEYSTRKSHLVTAPHVASWDGPELCPCYEILIDFFSSPLSEGLSLQSPEKLWCCNSLALVHEIGVKKRLPQFLAAVSFFFSVTREQKFCYLPLVSVFLVFSTRLLARRLELCMQLCV